MLTIDEIKKLYDLGKEVIPAIVEWVKSHNDRTSWESYKDIFDVDGFKVPYISLLNNWTGHIRTYGRSEIEVKPIGEKFTLPKALQSTPVPKDAFNGRKCRLAHFDISSAKSLAFTFQETDYFDYLKSGEYLDFPYPGNEKLTNRDAFGKVVREHNGNIWAFENLTNICGVGLFILTCDNFLLVSKHSEKSHVYPGRYTFSSSGTTSWEGNLNPFDQIVEKCFSEIGHRIDKDKLSLISFGLDARKLYFQFSFLEKSDLNRNQLLGKLDRNISSTNHQLTVIELNEEKIADIIVNNCWEPAAEVSALTIFVLENRKKGLMRALHSMKSQWVKKTMRDEWDYRASKSGLLPVMSVRYPQNRLSSISSTYVKALMKFIGDDIAGKSVVEIGSGIGRITEILEKESHAVTCVELCGRMISLSLSQLGAKDHVHYIQEFAQDYKPAIHHDVVISSLVLTHNTNDDEYEKLIANLCGIGDKIYIFEDVTEKRATSPRSRIRNKVELCSAFKNNGFSKVKEESFFLEEDQILFLKFIKMPSINIRANKSLNPTA